MNKTLAILFLLLAMLTIDDQNIQAQANHKATIAGKIETPYPTIRNLAVEWYIEGDENLNGKVDIKYRKTGTVSWNEGMQLRRVPSGANVGFTWKNKHSGSIFNLEPDTEYEIKLTLKDPDGGNAERHTSAKTRAVPEVTQDMEVVEIAPGQYDTLFTKSGTKEKPVVYRCSSGEASYEYIDLRNKKWVYIEGLNVYNIREHDEGLAIDLVGAENCVIRRCNIHAIYGIVADKPGAVNCYIADNKIRGIVGWTDEQTGASGNNVGEGIQISGPGNVICYNEVFGFRDAISTLEGGRAVNQRCIDIYNNEIYRNGDDGIEADFCISNCRIYNNRITNSYVGLSSQPGLGGPTYFIRNSMYNIIHSAFKLKRGSSGDVVMHNTVIRIGDGMGGNEQMDFAYFRNNLAIGGKAGETFWGGWGAGRPFGADIIDPGEHSDFDYDAVGVSGGVEYHAQIGGRAFSEVEEHGTEKIDMEKSFYNVDFPFPPFPERRIMDLRLKSESRAVDAGVHIPNINDGYLGKAPDCGAYELDQELPHYGPRLFDFQFSQ